MSKQIFVNRHMRRREAAMKGEKPYKKTGAHKIRTGYRGQKFEVQCENGDNKNYTVGWANNEAGVAHLCDWIRRHPTMKNPHVIELSAADKKALLNKD